MFGLCFGLFVLLICVRVELVGFMLSFVVCCFVCCFRLLFVFCVGLWLVGIYYGFLGVVYCL